MSAPTEQINEAATEYRAFHTVQRSAKQDIKISKDNVEKLKNKDALAYTIACVLREKGDNTLIETGDLDAMLDGGVENFFQKYSNLVKGLNLQLPTPEIRFDNMEYSVRVSIKSANTVGRKFSNFGHAFKSEEKKTVVKQVLFPMSGIIKPGSMTLVLGRPGCGKSSFLKALAGRLTTEKNSTFKGSIVYSGLAPAEVRLSKFVGLIDQTDQHCATLTVRETIQFADYCLNGNHSVLPEEIQGVAALRTDLLLHILGLTRQANTVVGDELLRGVSGGEKKRVTIGEMLVGGQSIFLCDEISTGLDSAATFDIIKSLRSWTEVLGGTVVVALLQPPPEVVDLFDNIALLSEGRLVYQGPRVSALPYFKTLGYEISSKLDPAEFFVEVVSERGCEFERLFRNSSIFEKLRSDIAQGFELPALPIETVAFREYFAMTKLASSKTSGPFALSFIDSLKLLTQRQSRVLFRDKSLLYGRLGEAAIMGILLGTLYYSASTSLYLRMLFYTIAILQRQAWQQITIAFQLRGIFYKQKSRYFYGSLAFGVSEAIVQVPLNLVISIVMGTPVYFFSGLAPFFKNYCIFILGLITFQHAIGSYFTFLTSISRSITGAQALAGISVCFFLLFSGNIILPPLIPDGWMWMYWFNPLSWALRTLMLNEYSSERYTSNQRKEALSSYEDHGNMFIWYGILMLLAYYVFFTVLKSVCLNYISFDSAKRPSTEKSNDSKDDVQVILIKNKSSLSSSVIKAHLAIKNLSYTVRVDGGDKILLENITAYFSPGTMTALMGASGAGKSTLLDVIAGRKTEGVASGQILVNGLPKNAKTFPRIAAYCEQMDIHSAGATVFEALLFSAKLRLPEQTEPSEILRVVSETLEVLELDSIKNAIIGTVNTGGISVEQRKRVTIGVELVSNPSILFLDEPTSGLDARSAVLVMRAVKNVTKQGKTIICTIHQPNIQLFYLFDSILLLKRGGRIAYFGPLEEESKNMLAYFASFPNAEPMKPKMNPATYILESIGAGIGRDTADAIDYADKYDESELKKVNDSHTETLSQPSYYSEKLPDLNPIATGLWNQILLTTVKTTKIYWRNPKYNFVRLVLFPLFAIIFGSTFFQIGYSSQQIITSHIALIYLTMDFTGIINMMTVLEITSEERAVYYRERSANMYSAFPYSISLFLAELPYLVAITGIFVSIEYWMVGLEHSFSSFFFYWFVFFLYVSACTFIGQLMCVLLPNAKVANVAVGAISCLFNLFSGYLIYLPNIPVWYSWLSYILPSRYALSALVSSQLGYCDNGTENGCKLLNYTNSSGVHEIQTTESYIRNTYNFYYEWRYHEMFVLIGMWIFLQVSMYFTLRFVSHLKR